MSTATPNLDLEYLDPSQQQPEVKVNANMDKIDAAVGEGIGISVTDATTSPPIERQARLLRFTGGVTVTHETDGVVVIHIDTSSGGGASIDVTDGSTTVSNITEIDFTAGAAVTASGSSAHVAIASGGTTGLACNNAVPMNASNVGWQNNSIVAIVSGDYLKAAAFTSIKARLIVTAGPGVIGAAVARTLPHGTTAFSTSTAIEWAGNPTPTLATGTHDSDAIAVTIDKDSDIWIIIFFSNVGGNASLGLGQGAAYVGSISGGYATGAGDHTADANTFALTSPPNIFGVGQVFGA